MPLIVPKSAARVFLQAKSYLSRDSAERAIFARLDRMRHQVHLALNAHDDDSYDPNTDTIHWDPRSALRTTAGGRQSPALGLGHECDHAVEPDRIAQRYLREPDAAYDNKEERRVICGSERHAAHTLGEDARIDHGGQCYRVRGPIAR